MLKKTPFTNLYRCPKHSKAVHFWALWKQLQISKESHIFGTLMPYNSQRFSWWGQNNSYHILVQGPPSTKKLGLEISNCLVKHLKEIQV